MDNESLNGIRHGLQDCRRQGLTQFTNQFMEVLISEGFTLGDFVESLADWEQAQEQTELVKRLEELSSTINS